MTSVTLSHLSGISLFPKRNCMYCISSMTNRGCEHIRGSPKPSLPCVTDILCKIGEIGKNEKSGKTAPGGGYAAHDGSTVQDRRPPDQPFPNGPLSDPPTATPREAGMAAFFSA
jgi:hypothetical protein